MKILHVVPSIDVRHGGSVASCLDLCRELSRQGEDVAICAAGEQRPPGDRGGRQADGVTIFDVPMSRGPYGVSVAMFNALRRAIPAIDIVHIHGIYRFHLPAAAALCVYYGVPYVVKPHGSLDPYLFRVRRWRKAAPEWLFVEPSLRYASAVHFTTAEEMILAASTAIFRNSSDGTVANAIIVPEGVTLDAASDIAPEEFVEAHPETRGMRLVLFLGRINFKKGLDILAKAFGLASRKRDDLWLVIAGPDNEGYASQVRGWLAAEGVLNRSTFTGMLVGAQKQAAYRAAAVFVLPSYTENFGMTIMEALNHGSPVVISTKVNIWRDLKAAGAGIVTECNAAHVAEAILKVVENPVAAREMVQRGRELVRRFSWELVAADMRAHYRRLVRTAALEV